MKKESRSTRSRLFACTSLSVAFVLSWRVYHHKWLHQALIIAVEEGDSDQVKRLLQQGGNPNIIVVKGYSLLYMADVAEGNVRSLLRAAPQSVCSPQEPPSQKKRESVQRVEEWRNGGGDAKSAQACNKPEPKSKLL